MKAGSEAPRALAVVHAGYLLGALESLVDEGWEVRRDLTGMIFFHPEHGTFTYDLPTERQIKCCDTHKGAPPWPT